jgi:hypothetical protein
MGYFMMPQALGGEINEIIREAAKVFIKTHGVPTGQLGMEIDAKRRVLRVTDKASGVSEMFTFAELGFL